MNSTIANLEFPADLARRVVSAMVDKPQVRGLIEALEEDREEVICEGVAYALAQWPKYDASKSAPSTFIQQRANSGVYDFLRKSGKQDRIEKHLSGALTKPDTSLELYCWVRDVFEAARRVYKQKRVNERRTFTVPQIVAIASLMQREKFSSRAAARFLADRTDIAAALRLKRIPDRRTLSRARNKANELLRLRPIDSAMEPLPDVAGDDPADDRNRVADDPPKARKRLPDDPASRNFSGHPLAAANHHT